MLPGFNHNIRYRDRVYHVQTEDNGISNPSLFTQLFHEGRVLAVERNSYQDILGENLDRKTRDERIKAKMQEQHKRLLKNLIQGEYDDRIAMFLGPSPLVGAEVEATTSESAYEPPTVGLDSGPTPDAVPSAPLAIEQDERSGKLVESERPRAPLRRPARRPPAPTPEMRAPTPEMRARQSSTASPAGRSSPPNSDTLVDAQLPPAFRDALRNRLLRPTTDPSDAATPPDARSPVPRRAMPSGPRRASPNASPSSSANAIPRASPIPRAPSQPPKPTPPPDPKAGTKPISARSLDEAILDYLAGDKD